MEEVAAEGVLLAEVDSVGVKVEVTAVMAEREA